MMDALIIDVAIDVGSQERKDLRQPPHYPWHIYEDVDSDYRAVRADDKRP
jgi:hypothetical protein